MQRHLVSACAAVLALAACARSEDVPDEAIEAADAEAQVLPPPVVTAEAPEAAAAVVVPATWQAAERGEGTTLRLITDDDEPLMTLSCANVPRELVAVVPGFTRSPSDSRFSLAMGSAPIILVADVAMTNVGQGVTARAPVPANLAAQLVAAADITAMYGTDKLGPYPAPGPKMVRGLLINCGVPASQLPPLPPEDAPPAQ